MQSAERERVLWVYMNGVQKFIVGVRVVCTCKFKSPVQYIDAALLSQVPEGKAYMIGHAMSNATERASSCGYNHYREIGEEAWKRDGHQWSYEEVAVSGKERNSLIEGRREKKES